MIEIFRIFRNVNLGNDITWKIVNWDLKCASEKSKNRFLKNLEVFVKIDFEKCEITLKNSISLNSNFEIENIT